MTCAAGLILAATTPRRHRLCRAPFSSRPAPLSATVGAARLARGRFHAPPPSVPPATTVAGACPCRHPWWGPSPPSLPSPSAVTVGVARVPRRRSLPRPSPLVQPASPVAPPALGHHRRCRPPLPSLPPSVGRHCWCRPPPPSSPPPSVVIVGAACLLRRCPLPRAAIIAATRLFCRLPLPRPPSLFLRVSFVASASLGHHRSCGVSPPSPSPPSAATAGGSHLVGDAHLPPLRVGIDADVVAGRRGRRGRRPYD